MLSGEDTTVETNNGMCAPGRSSTCCAPAPPVPQLTESRGHTLSGILKSTQTISHICCFSALSHPGQLLGRSPAGAPKLRARQMMPFSPAHLRLTLPAVCRHVSKLSITSLHARGSKPAPFFVEYSLWTCDFMTRSA